MSLYPPRNVPLSPVASCQCHSLSLLLPTSVNHFPFHFLPLWPRNLAGQLTHNCYYFLVQIFLSHTCHLSLRLTATAKDPPHANSPIMHSRLVCKNQKNITNLNRKKNHRNNKNPKMFRGMPILVMLSLQPTRKWVFHDGTGTHTDT